PPGGAVAAGLRRGGPGGARLDPAGPPVGHVLAGELEGHFHPQQMDVSPAQGRRGIGRALLEHACDVARARGYRHAVLTPLADVPWNAPFYASAGFRPLAPAAW